MEPAILWLEGADDLTPEAQAFLRRILETHAQDVLFILECRDASRLQEPIRSRCIIKRLNQPTWPELDSFLSSTFNGLKTQEIRDYLKPNEYSYRRAKQCAFLQIQYPDVWKSMIEHQKLETAAIPDLSGDNLITYIKEGYSPEVLINKLLSNEKILKDYGKCVEISGSLWAFLGSALYKSSMITRNEEE
jgi:hypothetical protein